MSRRVLALFVALVAAQPTLGWAAQAAARGPQGHCTNEICYCKTARRCPPRKAAAQSCHETSVPLTMMTGKCHQTDDVAPPTAVPGDSLGTAPVLTPAPVEAGLRPPLAGRRLAGHLENHSPPPKPILS